MILSRVSSKIVCSQPGFRSVLSSLLATRLQATLDSKKQSKPTKAFCLQNVLLGALLSFRLTKSIAIALTFTHRVFSINIMTLAMVKQHYLDVIPSHLIHTLQSTMHTSPSNILIAWRWKSSTHTSCKVSRPTRGSTWTFPPRCWVYLCCRSQSWVAPSARQQRRRGWAGQCLFPITHCFGGRSLLFMHASTEYRVRLPLHCMCTFEPLFQLYEHAQTRCFQCSVLLLHRTYPTWNQLRNMTCHRPQKLTFLSTPWSACQCSFLKVSFTRSTSKASIPCKTFGTQFLYLLRTASQSSCHILRYVWVPWRWMRSSVASVQTHVLQHQQD